MEGEASDSQLSKEELIKRVNCKIIECESLLDRSKSLLKGKQGASRLNSKILSEKKFYSKLLSTPEKIKEEHVRSTNLRHLTSVLDCVSKSIGVTEILKPVSFDDEFSNYAKTVAIDVVADQGRTWIKVVARNPQSLYLISLGAAGYGKRSLVHQMKDTTKCARSNPFLFEPPEVKVWFASGVAAKLKKKLKKINVESIGNCVEMSEHDVDDSSSSSNDSEDEIGGIDYDESDPIRSEMFSSEQTDCSNAALWKNKNLLTLSQIPRNCVLNLDVSTMIAYVSSVTNGNCHFIFKDAVLTEQAKSERRSPVKPILDQLFDGHELVCCEMARHDFVEIISTIGGTREKERAKRLLDRVKTVPNQPSEKANNLNISGKVKTRSRVIFGTGDTLKAVTITANQGCLRACQGQGVNFVSFIHESRALTEIKEPMAQKI